MRTCKIVGPIFFNCSLLSSHKNAPRLQIPNHMRMQREGTVWETHAARCGGAHAQRNSFFLSLCWCAWETGGCWACDEAVDYRPGHRRAALPNAAWLLAPARHFQYDACPGTIGTASASHNSRRMCGPREPPTRALPAPARPREDVAPWRWWLVHGVQIIARVHKQIKNNRSNWSIQLDCVEEDSKAVA
jgi:hypothetical protein